MLLGGPSFLLLEPSIQSIGTKPIKYRGGPIMKNVKVNLIFYGNHSTQTVGIIQRFVSGISNSSWWNISRNYYDKNNEHVGNVKLHNTWFDDYSHGKVHPNIQEIVSLAIKKSRAGPDNDAVYFVLTSPDVSEKTIWGQFCQKYCGYHNYFRMDKVNIKYSFVGDGARCPNCWAPYIRDAPSINNDNAADGFIRVIAHELTEMATDPLVGPNVFNLGWIDDDLQENADKCQSQYFDVQNEGFGAWNIELETGKFLINPNWSVKTQSCVMGE
jgi:hypothetical protein